MLRLKRGYCNMVSRKTWWRASVNATKIPASRKGYNGISHHEYATIQAQSRMDTTLCASEHSVTLSVCLSLCRPSAPHSPSSLKHIQKHKRSRGTVQFDLRKQPVQIQWNYVHADPEMAPYQLRQIRSRRRRDCRRKHLQWGELREGTQTRVRAEKGSWVVPWINCTRPLPVRSTAYCSEHFTVCCYALYLI